MNVLAVAGDAGGANAVAPVIRQLLEMAGVTVTCRAYAAAAHLWDTAGFNPQPVRQPDLGSCDRLLLGTSVNQDQWELQFILEAKARRIPSLCVLDAWINYRERFLFGDGRTVLPEVIAVMDEYACHAMLNEGFPSECLRVTGQPAFDDLAPFDHPEAVERARNEVNHLVGIRDHELRILYVSQPLSQLWSKEVLGFHEREVLVDIVQALERVLQSHAVKASLLVKLHPRDSRESVLIPKCQSSYLRIAVIENNCLDPRHLVLGSDFVCGMNSTLLMEACLLKKPVISYQPNLQISDPLPTNLNGWSCAVRERATLESALEAELFDQKSKTFRQGLLKHMRISGGAAARIVKLLKNLSPPPSYPNC